MAFDNVPSISLSTAPARIADILRSSILDGSFAPGSQLTEAQLAERLDVSRGPVREAMQRLVQEGLLSTRPHHGMFVVELGASDVPDVYLARRAIESTAAVRVMARSDKAKALKALEAALTDLRKAITSGDWRGIVSTDLRFHELLVAEAGSERLSRMFRTLTAETQLCMAAFLEVRLEWTKGLVKEYKELLAAMKRGDTTGALTCIDRHFELDETLRYYGDVDSHLRHTDA
ncbi:GntR family transcriptional regulator [Mycobacterium sp. URHB0044]|jgi:DNA-binding GntR family transcriptional regulator|uniref:GntR family transcriptional regulator n=1 Tax=Mycobacterium sp. URHB0044 TaxID=1380386 RepID=UPI000686278E|nr:GntR family transcriptional regulator [Mycobacterium sp. URHB0044]